MNSPNSVKSINNIINPGKLIFKSVMFILFAFWKYNSIISYFIQIFNKLDSVTNTEIDLTVKISNYDMFSRYISSKYEIFSYQFCTLAWFYSWGDLITIIKKSCTLFVSKWLVDENATLAVQCLQYNVIIWNQTIPACAAERILSWL